MIRIKTTTFGFPTINILTQSDVWLPYDLYANPQLKLQQFNAPRLQKALQKIQNFLGIEAMMEDTDLADLNQDFTLSNRTDVAGDILKYDPEMQKVYL